MKQLFEDLPDYFRIAVIIDICSSVTSALVIISYYKFSELRNAPYTLIFWLACSTLIQNLSILLFKSPRNGSVECYIQYFFLQIFTTVNLLCTALFTRYISSLFADFNRSGISFKLNWKSYAFVWGISIFSSVPPIITSSIGLLWDKNEKSICWVQANRQIDYVWIFICYYVPLYATIVYIFFLYSYILTRTKGILLS